MRERESSTQNRLEQDLDKTRQARLNTTFLVGSFWYVYLNYIPEAFVKLVGDATKLDIDIKRLLAISAISIAGALTQEKIKHQSARIGEIKERIVSFRHEDENVRAKFSSQ